MERNSVIRRLFVYERLDRFKKRAPEEGSRDHADIKVAPEASTYPENLRSRDIEIVFSSKPDLSKSGTRANQVLPKPLKLRVERAQHFLILNENRLYWILYPQTANLVVDQLDLHWP